MTSYESEAKRYWAHAYDLRHKVCGSVMRAVSIRNMHDLCHSPFPLIAERAQAIVGPRDMMNGAA